MNIKITHIKSTHRLRVLGALELRVRRAQEKYNKELKAYFKEHNHPALGLYHDMEAQNGRE